MVLLPVIALWFGGLEMQAQEFVPNYDESKVPKYTLPDPLVMESGEKVRDVEIWKAKRRPEILELFKEHVYGAMPPAIAHAVEEGKPAGAIGGLGTRKEVTLTFERDGSGPQIHVLILLPSNAKGPVPAFLGYNFNGNHTVHADPGIRLAKVWDRKPGSEAKIAEESTRGEQASRWQVEKVLSRGYALVTVYYGDVDPDFYDEFKNGVHVLYPDYQNREDNWTAIGGWAWGLSRVLDYLETDKAIDAKRVAVIGHSRLGKTSLWTGATDERFALVISNNSGCGGAALARRAYGETVARINTSFPHWFTKSHKKYNNNEAALPIDQHELIALIAPRPVYVASAQEDQWADPQGEFLSCVGADPVYRLFGLEGLSSKTFPEPNHPLATGHIGYHIRTGKHDVTAYDWDQYLNFADKHLGNEK